MKQKKLTRKQIKEAQDPEAVETIIDEDFDINIMIKSMPLCLDLAGIYYIGAHMNYNQGVREYKLLEKQINKYKIIYQKRLLKYEINTEEFITYMMNKLRNIEIFYEPVIRHFVTTKILLICCIESYINEIAKATISGRKLEEFDKLTIIGKWLLIQDILKLKNKFSVDKNPLQGLDKLIKERNRLMHFKGMKKDMSSLEVPNFIEDLKLTPMDCLMNINQVAKSIETISLKWKGSYGPNWLKVESSTYRNPCFYLGDRAIGMVLYSDEYDKGR